MRCNQCLSELFVCSERQKVEDTKPKDFTVSGQPLYSLSHTHGRTHTHTHTHTHILKFKVCYVVSLKKKILKNNSIVGYSFTHIPLFQRALDLASMQI